MQTNTSNFGERISLPDSWQRKALGYLRDGNDLVLHAPTGAGKTYVFEKLIDTGWKGKAVYTVPTRALANDKFREWQKRGWQVGLSTGDIRYKTDSNIIVATLETQRSSIIEGTGPDLFVVDEYQLLSDRQRGAAYEITLAMAPKTVQLLLMSGSVGNPHEVADWLGTHNRAIQVVSEFTRPVPLDEVFAEALLKRPFRGRKIRGHWPKLISQALDAGMGPILVFAPRRKSAEDLARQLAIELPTVDGLELTKEQKQIVGKELSSLLKKRVVYHHSGLDYLSRACVIEPLAKAGQLQVVVATTGLGAGINFSTRSVLVTDREYRLEDGLHLLRPDELLQMFGRAGRRGLDDRGYVIIAPKQPRLGDARPLNLKRSQTLDWPAIIRIMHHSHSRGEDHLEAARTLAFKLFTDEKIRLGLRDSINKISARKLQLIKGSDLDDEDSERNEVIEMRNSQGLWERRGGQSQALLGEAFALYRGEWVNALSLPDTLSRVRIGNPCRFGTKKNPTYGREWPVAIFEKGSDRNLVTLTKSFRKKLRDTVSLKFPELKKRFSRKTWRRNGLENVFQDLFPSLSMGGEYDEFVERDGVLRVRLRYENATILGWKDARGKILLNPPLRKIKRIFESPFKEKKSGGVDTLGSLSPAEAWLKLGLIDQTGIPTQRGRIFSFFSRGEGLAISVGLEDETFPIEEFIFELANLRAGHRFRSFTQSDSRLSFLCRQAFGFENCMGYLRKGLPLDYGEGASEVVRDYQLFKSSFLNDEEDLRIGDVERVITEWKSLMSVIAHAPKLESKRWHNLQILAGEFVKSRENVEESILFPELPSRQRSRFHYRKEI